MPLMPEDLEEYETVHRWKDEVGEGKGWQVFRRALCQYCNLLKMNPDQIIKMRKQDLRNDDEEIRRRHEEYYTRFHKWLKVQKSQLQPNKPLSTSTISTSLIAVRSFYKRNYYPLIEVKTPAIYRERPLHVPTPEELGRMVKAVSNIEHKAMILAAAQSGISLSDLLSIRWDTKSPSYGSIAKQLTNHHKLGIIHIHLVRMKTKTEYDSFFGSATFEALKEMGVGRGPIFTLGARHFERIVADVAEDAHIEGIVTPHCLRKFFSTRLKMARVNDPAWNDTLIEWWCGHSLGRVKGAYFIPPVEEQAKLYLLAQERITPIFPTD